MGLRHPWRVVGLGVVGAAVGVGAWGCESLGGLSANGEGDAGEGGAPSEAGADVESADAAGDASASDASDGGDAAVKGIRCGTMRCAFGEACCASRDAGTFVCKAASDCFDTTFRCEKTADCTAAGFPDGTQCCGQWTGSSCGMTKSACGTCPLTNGEMCDQDLPFACGDAAACVPLQCWPNTYYVCQ